MQLAQYFQIHFQDMPQKNGFTIFLPFLRTGSILWWLELAKKGCAAMGLGQVYMGSLTQCRGMLK